MLPLLRSAPALQLLRRGARLLSLKGAIAIEPVKGGPRALSRAAAPAPKLDEACGPLPAADDDLSDTVSVVDPITKEWGGPTKGGTMPEPTRFGDWERKGRCSAWAELFRAGQSSAPPVA